MSTKQEDVSRRIATQSTVEAVLIETLTESFGPTLKAAQITLALEPQIVDIIIATRAAAIAERAATLYDVRAYLAKTLDNFEESEVGLSAHEVREFIGECLEVSDGHAGASKV